MMNTIGACIAVCRNNKRWTQERLASAIKLTQGQLSDIENDKVSPRWKTINQIAHALDVSIVQLLPTVQNRTNEPNKNANGIEDNNNYSREQELYEAFQKVQEELLETKNKLISLLEQK